MGSVGAGMRKEWLLFADPTACGCKPNKLDIIYDARAGNNQSPVRACGLYFALDLLSSSFSRHSFFHQ
jgi:hypothetical protein